jgi:tetratricopeptide (TPR) repeat protein
MSLLDRFLGGRRSKAYAEGMQLASEGRYAEAIGLLRSAALGRADSPGGSLASVHFRQALVQEGRRLLRAGKYADACQPLGEAAGHWELYPDLQCLHGAAQGFAGHWDQALVAARSALRLNSDYVEARLLEAVALQAGGRTREAAVSLNALVESGRRVGHWLIAALEREKQYTEADLPADLPESLLKCVSGRSEKEEVAEAVTLCRAGHWEKGLVRFADLVQRHPRYPDYRTRHAAALFQLRKLDEALAETEAALALNESYQNAIYLKTLILADLGRFWEARTFLSACDAEGEPDGKRGAQAHEELFGAYLRGVLALLTGEPDAVPGILEDWPDLVRTFARAELLLAASDDLRGREASCGRRLAGLADEWVGESLYFFLLACHRLESRAYAEVASVLTRWPIQDTPDLRPLYLENTAAVCQGEPPQLPAADDPDMDDQVSAEAWLYLEARGAYLAGDDQRAHEICTDLMSRGYGTERLLRLKVAAELGRDLPAAHETARELDHEAVLPDSCLPPMVFAAHRRQQSERAHSLLLPYRSAHPEFLVGHWLSPDFWLEPVRGWIA